MIQDIGPQRLMNHYENRQVTENDFVMIFDGRNIFVKEDEEIRFLTVADYEKMQQAEGFTDQDFRYLFTIGEDDYFLPDFPKERFSVLSRYGKFIRLSEFRSRRPLKNVMAGATAYHIYTWYHASRFCGVCGTKTVHDGRERMMKCPACGNTIYPKIAPAVIVAVRNQDKLLLTKYANREYKKYALIAGFAEIGETIEETVQREVWEETGVHVKNITYYKSQPWGFDSDLLMGFFCDLDGDDVIRLDEEELAVAEWVRADDIPEGREGISLTEEMMMYFKHGILAGK